METLISGQNSLGQYPLHCASVAHDIGEGALELIVSKDLDAIAVPDPSQKGDYPLHLLLRSDPTKDKIIQKFATHAPEAVGLPDKQGILPFLRAARGSTLDTLFCILQLNPGVLVALINWKRIGSQN